MKNGACVVEDFSVVINDILSLFYEPNATCQHVEVLEILLRGHNLRIRIIFQILIANGSYLPYCPYIEFMDKTLSLN